MKHSPLPWEIENCHTGEGCWCRLIKHSEVGWDNQDEIDEPYVVNIAGSIPKEDAEFIVKACNAHYELVEALDTIADYGGYLTGEDALEMKRVACSALERLKGEIE